MLIHRSYPKDKRVKDPDHLKWVATLGDVINGDMNCCAHHLINDGIGLSGTGTKVDDYLTFALSNKYHSATSEFGLHKDVKKWESDHQPQVYYVIDTLNIALDANKISTETWSKYIEICERIIEAKQ